ncbi:MAG: alkylation repair protein [Herbinix sp.]|jgi:3-methyladenine DNA glycosylase AlkD|nr:alkylation repair protein [Herbinix sp.]
MKQTSEKGLLDAKSIKEELKELAEEKYRIFSASLIPGKENVLGVRLPLLRKLAVRIAKGDWQDYLNQAQDDTMEEVMLQGMVIGTIKTDIEVILKLTEEFIPKIDCWSVCDSFCGSLKIVKDNRERVWKFLQQYFNSDQEYDIRFGVVMLLGYYVLPEYYEKAFTIFDNIKQEGYYVKMAVAWAISTYYTSFPDQTLDYLKRCNLDDFTYNKALQKITESLKVDLKTKEIIRSMKRVSYDTLGIKK